MPRLSLALLGPPLIARDGVLVALDRQKAVALLAYLAVAGGRHHREALAALFWPDLGPPRAQAGLRQALWALNNALGPGHLVSDRQGVALSGSELELDVAAFRAQLAAARRDPDNLESLRAAVALYRGDLLDGLELRDSAPFAEWRFLEAEALRRELATALELLAERLTRSGAHEEAVAAARRWVALDPLHEPAHRALMRCYDAAGQRSAAMRQYEECARVLAAELGAAPETATQALYAAIRAGRQERSPDGVSAAAGAASLARLPVPATPFVGRADELAQIARLLSEPACRLLTLLGPGGIGKTRLAIEAAGRLAGQFPDGACFVPLAAVATPDLIASAVAEALGLELFRRERVLDQLLDFLRPRALLLVADNLEQLVAGASVIGELIEGAPGLKILATSRERLGLPGEWTLDIGGLGLPEAGAARAAAAIQLFLDGARRSSGGHEPGDDDLPAIARICRLVGGAPLAIELAAAWARLMPCAEIADAIARDLDFLSTDAQGMPARHRGLRAVFEHSWRLLDGEQQAAFRRIAIFRGGFTREAVAAVLGAPPGPAGRGLAARALAALADRSLVRAGGAGRYDIHELLRQYAAERLAANPAEEEAARAAHAAYYLELLRRSEADLKGAGQRAALVALGADLDNLRAAWRHAAASANWQGLAAAAESLFVFYEITSLFEEGEDSFGRAAAAVDSASDLPEELQILLANLLARQGWFALRRYRFDTAGALFAWSLELIERTGPRRETLVAELLANSPMATGGRLRSEARLQEQLERVRRTGDPWMLALALNAYAWTRTTRAEAQALLEEALAVARGAGDLRAIAVNLADLASVTREGAELRRAVSYWEEALAIYRELGYRWAYAYCLDEMAYALRQIGDVDRAEELHRESLEVSRAIGDRLGVAGSFDNLALVALERGDCDEAERLAQEGLALRRAVDHKGSTTISLLTLAKVALKRGDLEDGLRWLDRCQAETPWEHDGLHARALQLRARVAQERGNLADARLLLRTALEIVADGEGFFDLLTIFGQLAEVCLAEGDEVLAARLAAAARSAGGDIIMVQEQARRVLERTGPPAHPLAPDALVAQLRG